jgi:hypothetical protein
MQSNDKLKDNEDQKLKSNDDNNVTINTPDSSNVLNIKDIKNLKDIQDHFQDYLNSYSFSNINGDWTGIY